ncbi:MAG TPA: sulfatase [Phycisphaerae bacterium]|nr:sulfatase [Phycisphaerae bacterium]
MPKSSRRQFLGTLAGAATAASLSRHLRAQTTIAKPKKPMNVLFFMSDDMRVELSCYNSMFGCKTPNLDALANAGVRFDRNYCQFPLCNPSRSSMMTGRRPTETGVLGNAVRFRNTHPDWVSLPQLYKENGYASLRAGKIFHGGMDDPKAWNEGYGVAEGNGGAGGTPMSIPRTPIPMPDGVLPPLPADTSQAAHSDQLIVLEGMGEAHPDYHTADTAIEYLRKYKNEPFFLGCGFVKPHSPPCAPQKFLDMYDVDKIKLTPDFAAWPTVPSGFPSAAIRKRNADLFIGRGASEKEAREVIRMYIASISWADWNLGRVVAELDKLGLRDNTIIMFSVDHGYQLGEKGKWSKAGSLFEMGCRTPLIMAVPGMKGNGKPCYRIVEQLDVYPTLVGLCGLPAPANGGGLVGKSLTPLLANPEAPWDKPAYSVWSEDGTTLHGVAVRTADWRFAEYGRNGENGAMLFDPKKDPLELKNLADDPQFAKVKAELSALTRQYAATLKT